MAAAALAVPVVGVIILALVGGGKKKIDPKTEAKIKAAYDAGYAKGISDKQNGLTQALNPSADFAGSKLEKAAYDKGYSDGFAAGIKPVGPVDPGKGGGGGGKTVGDIIDKKPADVSVAEIELAAERGRIDGYNKGKDDALANRPKNPYAYGSMPSHATLREAYQIAFRSNYADGYSDGQKMLATMAGGYGPGFAPAAYRRDGYPRHWYNY